MISPLRIALCGSSHTNDHPEPLIEKASKIAEALSCHGSVLAVANQTGLPLLVTKLAKRKGVATIVFSGARDEKEHKDQFQEDSHHADMVVYTGFGRPGSELIMVRSIVALLVDEPDLHTERQINYALENNIPVGFLTKHTDHEDFMKQENTYYSEDPEELLENLIETLR
jgi:hypothetical protein